MILTILTEEEDGKKKNTEKRVGSSEENPNREFSWSKFLTQKLYKRVCIYIHTCGVFTGSATPVIRRLVSADSDNLTSTSST